MLIYIIPYLIQSRLKLLAISIKRSLYAKNYQLYVQPINYVTVYKLTFATCFDLQDLAVLNKTFARKDFNFKPTLLNIVEYPLYWLKKDLKAILTFHFPSLFNGNITSSIIRLPTASFKDILARLRENKVSLGWFEDGL